MREFNPRHIPQETTTNPTRSSQHSGIASTGVDHSRHATSGTSLTRPGVLTTQSDHVNRIGTRPQGHGIPQLTVTDRPKTKEEPHKGSVFGTQRDTLLKDNPNGITSVAYHNVGDVLQGANPSTRDYVNRHYGPRAGAVDWTANRVGIAVKESTAATETQAEYLSGVVGRPVEVIPLSELRRREGEKPDTLVVPYINNHKAQETLSGLGQETWGLPPELVAKLKDKASFNTLVEQAQIPGLEVPDFQIADKETVGETTRAMVNFTSNLYSENGVAGTYPVGVIVRSNHSDGNYGMAVMKQNAKGEIVYIPDGKGENSEVLPPGRWDIAIEKAQAHLREVVEDDATFVVSRMIDRAEEPGNSFILTNGQPVSLGWNAQLLSEGGTACVGTADYASAAKNTAIAQSNGDIGKAQEIYAQKMAIRDQYEAPTAAAFQRFLHQVAAKQGIDITTVSGATNIDIMVPGPWEQELRKRRGKPDGVYAAEANPRWTNSSDATMLAVGASGEQPNFGGLERVRNNGIMSIDAYEDPQLGPDLGDLVAVRKELLVVTADHAQKGVNAIMRMPLEKPGMVFTGDFNQGQELFRQAVQRANKRKLTVVRG